MSEILSTETANDQLDEMVAYRDAFRAAGKEMLREAHNAQRMAEVVRLTLMRMWEQRSKAVEAQVIATATAATRSIMDMTSCYWKAIEARCKLTSEARRHWVDSAAIHEILSARCQRRRRV